MLIITPYSLVSMHASYAVRSVDGPIPTSFQIWLRVAASLFLGLFLLIHDERAVLFVNACLRSNSPTVLS